MKAPIEVTVDPEFPVCYVRYVARARYDGSLELVRGADGVVHDRPFDEGRQTWSGALIDVARDDGIIGVEILNVDDPVMVGLARDYAADNGLAFPTDLRAAAKAVS